MHVLQQIIKKRQAVLLAICFLRLLKPAEFASRGVTRLLRRHAAANVFFGEEVEVSAEFGVEAFVEMALAKKSKQTRRENAQTVQIYAPSEPRRRAITAAIDRKSTRLNSSHL